MIIYDKGAFGLNLFTRFRGSAVYKAVIPGVVSVLFFMLLQWLYSGSTDPEDLDHPYVVGVIVTSVSFIIIFRTNNAYQRYWEACGAVHHMMSKFLDATVHMGCFHMQCDHFDEIKPPVFYDYPELLNYNLSRDRERINDNDVSGQRLRMSINQLTDNFVSKMSATNTFVPQSQETNGRMPLLARGRIDGGWNKLLDDPIPEEHEPLNFQRRKDTVKDFGETPSLFLLELAHLSSLLVAVAFSTLRYDVEGSESPLGTFYPGSDWPAADPDKMTIDEKAQIRTTLFQKVSYWVGRDRTPEYRTKYNAARPMLVFGGVSECEVKQLQRARGASAKTTLAWYWLSEFIGREHIAGSTGEIGAPIISRLFQFLSDGMIFYNHARKIMFIPFPFPHAQLSAVYVAVITFVVPFMMNQFANEPWLGSLLTFLVVSCLNGLHEVGRELENPYRNTPNEIPLCTLLAYYNEALVAMCTGYHPDGYWNEDIGKRKRTKPTKKTEEKKESKDEMKEMKKTIERQAIELQELRALFERNNHNTGS